LTYKFVSRLISIEVEFMGVMFGGALRSLKLFMFSPDNNN